MGLNPPSPKISFTKTSLSKSQIKNKAKQWEYGGGVFSELRQTRCRVSYTYNVLKYMHERIFTQQHIGDEDVKVEMYNDRNKDVPMIHS